MNLSFLPVISFPDPLPRQLLNPMQLVPVCATVVLICHAASLSGFHKVQPDGRLALLSNPSTKGGVIELVILNMLCDWSLLVFPSLLPFGLLVEQINVCVPAVTVMDGRVTVVDIPVANEPIQLCV